MIKLSKNQILRLNQEKIKDKNVILRVDFNVNLVKGKIFDQYRILSVKETLNVLKPAKKILLISHLDDPEKPSKTLSFKNLIPQIEKILKIKIGFIKDFDSSLKEKINLFENIRFWKEEKKLDLNFAKKIAKFGDVFVNDAFSVSHRKHTSVYLLSKILPIYYGLNFEKEINLLNKVFKAKNLIFILGGAKISTKLPLIKNFLNKADLIILAGGLANSFYQAKGFEVGKSLVEKEILNEIKNLNSPKIFLPFDFYGLNSKNKFSHFYLGEIKKDDILYDIGHESLKIIFEEIKKAKNIVWNGPLGYIEDKRFEKGTFELVKFLAKLKNKFILIGGGDTLGFLEKKKMIKKFKNLSTGGGAMLYYLAKENLPIFENGHKN